MRKPDRLCRKKPGRPRSLTAEQERALAGYWTAGVTAPEIVELIRYRHGGIIGVSSVGRIAKLLGLASRGHKVTLPERWRCPMCYALAEGATCIRGHTRTDAADTREVAA
jgi:hypothetical protein